MRAATDHPPIIPDLRAIDAIIGGLIDFFEQRSLQSFAFRIRHHERRCRFI